MVRSFGRTSPVLLVPRSLRSYNRGPPLLPSETDHVDGVKAITVTAGEDGDRQGRAAWSSYLLELLYIYI